MTRTSIAPRVAIVGAAIPAVAKMIPGETSMSLTVKAVQAALDDAGMEAREVNGACIGWPGPGGSPLGGSTNWAGRLSSPLNWVIESGLDATGIRGVLNATGAIGAGLCETAIVAGAVAGTGTSIRPQPVGSPLDAPRAAFEFADPFGAGIMQRFAITARRHMHDFGTTPEQLAEVAATIRNFGHINPEATMFGKGPYTTEDILSSRMVADPLHLLDCGLTGQGGAALVLTTMERARQLTRRPVAILAGAMELSRGPHATPSLNRDEGMLGAARMARAWQRAGIGPEDVDVASLYDATSFEVIRNIEMLGFCREGEGGPFVENGALSLGGRLPTNTDGGLLSHGFAMTAQLIMKIVEAVRQLRGQCGSRQVEGAEVAVCTNSVATAHHIEALVLGAA